MVTIFILLLVFANTADSNTADSSSSSKWVIELDTTRVLPEEFAAQNGFRYLGPTHVDPNLHIFSIIDGGGGGGGGAGSGSTKQTDRFAHQHLVREFLEQHPHVEWSEQQVPKTRYTRSVSRKTDDPMYKDQWHLWGNSPSCVGINQTAPYKGRGVLIGMVDDGLEHRHPELSANYDASHSWNYNGGDGGNRDPTPQSHTQGHGTSAAGVAVGVQYNGHCGQGAAPLAKVAGLRLIAAPVSDLDESEALSKYADDIDIYSNSWGPVDSGRGMEGPGRLVRTVFAQFAGGGRGRRGKGSIYVWASGNGRANQDTCAFDGYASNPYVNAIGAVDIRGRPSWYSEGCASLMAVAPSSGSMQGIVTSDLMGPSGYDPTECTSTFGGTSSAAPLASGIIALLLEASNYTLTWRDVKHIIARGATQIHSGDADVWNVNDAGYHHSNQYGFGLLQVEPLLKILREYVPVPSIQKQVFSEIVYPSGSGSGLHGLYEIEMEECGISFIETVVLTISLQHPQRGDVSISIRSPSNVTSLLAPFRYGDTTADYPMEGWSFSSVRHWGEPTGDGTWTIIVKDLHNNVDVGSLLWLRVGILGY